MPYAEPTSPVPAPLKQTSPLKQSSELSSRRTSHDSNHTMSFRSVSAPMPGIPRRSPSVTSPPSTTTPLPDSSSPDCPLSSPPPRTPRHSISSAVAGALASMRSVDSLPSSRRTALSPSRPIGSLGLHLFGNHSNPIPNSSSSTTHSNSTSHTGSSNDALRTPPEKGVPFPSSGAAKARPESHSAHSPPKIALTRKPGRDRVSSSSAIHPPAIAISPNSPRPTSMVRKKSGELVKSSLKQRSMSTPDLGRGKDKPSDDALRQRTKSVRFDDLGLESVVLFLRGQRPTDVSKAAVEPASTETPTETEDDNDTDLADFVHFRTRRNGQSRPETAKEIQITSESTIPRLRLDFGPGTHGILKNENVLVERVDMQNGSPLALRGTVLVRNLAFHKWVAIRFTLDHWQTVSEVACTHVSHIPAGTTGDEGWDRFSFLIRLEDYRRKIEERRLQLCARFSIDGHEWWDSNNGDNYRFNFKRAPRKQEPPRTSTASSIHSGLRAPRSADKNPLAWLFPRTAQTPIERSASPMQSPPPAAAFQPPSTPDVHNHLLLKRYCAPSPPKSPPQKLLPATILPLAPERAGGRPSKLQTAPTESPTPPTSPKMILLHGHPATVSPTTEKPPHERSQSWSGQSAETWPVSPTQLSMSDGDEVTGDTTPRAARARSPETGPPAASLGVVTGPSPTSTPSSSEDEKPAKGLIRRSTNDLRALVNDTPPSSNLSSPPTPSVILPGPLSDSAAASTGDSSPVNTNNAGSPGDPSALEESGRTLNAATYQEFLDKFCFFKSPPPVLAPLEDPYSSSHMTGFSSPSIYGYFGAAGLGAGTATQQHPHGDDAPACSSDASAGSATTPRATSPARSAGATTIAANPWTPTNENGPAGPPSLAAA